MKVTVTQTNRKRNKTKISTIKIKSINVSKCGGFDITLTKEGQNKKYFSEEKQAGALPLFTWLV